MKELTSYKKMALVSFSLLLTAFSMILGAIPLRVFKVTSSEKNYWLVAIGVFASLIFFKAYVLASTFLALSLLVGIFSYLQKAGNSLEFSSFSSLLIVGSISIFSFYYINVNFGSMITDSIKEKLALFMQSSSALKIENMDKFMAEVMLQIPSVIVIVLAVALFFALFLENRTLSAFKIPLASNVKLIDFKVPEGFIFLFILSLLGSFYQPGLETEFFATVKTVSLNLLNVFIFLYFFQGLAVLSVYFKTYKVGIFWRYFLGIVIVTQLFLALAIIGVTDYWLDYRKKLHKKSVDLSNKSLEEK